MEKIDNKKPVSADDIYNDIKAKLVFKADAGTGHRISRRAEHKADAFNVL